MFNYEDIADRFWNLPQKGMEEYNREINFIDDIIQKSHIENELLKNLEGVSTVFDGGAGYGRFSVFLAKKGIYVTHFDISDSMLKVAKEYAKAEGVYEKINFVKGRLGDLSEFEDNSFDMVVSFDAPISYTYPNHEEVIKNLVRISKDKVIISVSSRLGHFPYFMNPNNKLQYLLDKNSEDLLVQWYLRHSQADLKDHYVDFDKMKWIMKTGLMDECEEVKNIYLEGKSPWPVTYLFMPEELKEILERYGASEVKLAGPGAFSRTIPNEVLVKLISDEKQRKEFLDFCYEYDSNPSVAGMGKDNLLAAGRKKGIR